VKTVGIATSAGYDCDNQAATCAGLIGALHGTKCLPADLVAKFNDQYVCFTRDDVPIATPLSNIVERIATIAKTAIMDNGGRIEFRRADVSSLAGKTLASDFNGVEYTFVFGENGTATVSGGDLSGDAESRYAQKDSQVWIRLRDTWREAVYDGESIEFGKGETLGDVVYIVNSDF